MTSHVERKAELPRKLFGWRSCAAPGLVSIMERTCVDSAGSRYMQRLLMILGILMLAAILTPAELKGGDSILARVGDRGVTAREIEQSLAIPLYDLEMEKYRLM